jgi:hypothetical protein
MPVALHARVSRPHQPQEGTLASQVRSLRYDIHPQGWSRLPDHEFLDEGINGARLDRPALDRLRDGAQRGEFDAVVVLSPDRLARDYAHQCFRIEELRTLSYCPSMASLNSPLRRLVFRAILCPDQTLLWPPTAALEPIGVKVIEKLAGSWHP